MTAGTINDNRLARIPRVRRAGAAGNCEFETRHRPRRSRGAARPGADRRGANRRPRRRGTRAKTEKAENAENAEGNGSSEHPNVKDQTLLKCLTLTT